MQAVPASPKCQVFPYEPAAFAWQPFGPEEDYRNAITEPGSFYRGFPVIKIGMKAYEDIRGNNPVRFTYKGVEYVAWNGEVLTKAVYDRRAIDQHIGKLYAFLEREDPASPANGVQNLSASVEVYEVEAPLPDANFRPHASTLSAALKSLQQKERLDVAAYVEQDALKSHEAEERAAVQTVGKGDLVRVPMGSVNFYGIVKQLLPLRNAAQVQARGDVRVGHTVPMRCIEVLMTRAQLEALAEKKTLATEVASAS